MRYFYFLRHKSIFCSQLKINRVIFINKQRTLLLQKLYMYNGVLFLYFKHFLLVHPKVVNVFFKVVREWLSVGWKFTNMVFRQVLLFNESFFEIFKKINKKRTLSKWDSFDSEMWHWSPLKIVFKNPPIVLFMAQLSLLAPRLEFQFASISSWPGKSTRVIPRLFSYQRCNRMRTELRGELDEN